MWGGHGLCKGGSVHGSPGLRRDKGLDRRLIPILYLEIHSLLGLVFLLGACGRGRRPRSDGLSHKRYFAKAFSSRRNRVSLLARLFHTAPTPRSFYPSLPPPCLSLSPPHPHSSSPPPSLTLCLPLHTPQCARALQSPSGRINSE